jgi:hypothetical protein
MNNTPTLSPGAFRKLVQLNRTLTFILFAANRDPVNGTFKPGTAITPQGVRAAFGLPRRGSVIFKRDLLAALKARRK